MEQVGEEEEEGRAVHDPLPDAHVPGWQHSQVLLQTAAMQQRRYVYIHPTDLSK